MKAQGRLLEMDRPAVKSARDDFSIFTLYNIHYSYAVHFIFMSVFFFLTSFTHV